MDDSFSDGLLELIENAEAEYEFTNNTPAASISHILDEVGNADDINPTTDDSADDETVQQVKFSLRKEDKEEIQLVDEFISAG